MTRSSSSVARPFSAAIRHGLVNPETLLERLGQTLLDAEQRGRLEKMIQADAADTR